MKVNAQTKRFNHLSNLFQTIRTCFLLLRAVGQPALVYMWTANRLELEQTDVQLFCRASGYPQPEITWVDGQGNDLELADPEKYQVRVCMSNNWTSKYMLHTFP